MRVPVLDRRAVHSLMRDPAERSARARRWQGMLVAATTTTVASVQIGVANVIFPRLRDVFGLTTTSIGVFTTIALLARALCGPVWGMLADRFGRKRVLTSAVLTWSVCIAATGLAGSFSQFVLLYSLGFVGAMAAEPVIDSLLSDFFPAEKRGVAFGIMRALMSLGVGVLMPLMGLLSARAEGWRLCFFALAGFQFISGCLVLFGLREPTVGASEHLHAAHVATRFSLRNVGRLLRVPSVRWFALNYVLATSLVMLAYLSTFLHDVKGFSVPVTSRIYGLLHIGAVLGAMLGGNLGDWAARRSPARGRVRLMQIYLATFAAYSIVIFQVPWRGEAFAHVLIFGFGVLFPIGFSGCVLPMLSTIILPELRSTGFGLLASFCQGVSLAATSLVVGALAGRYGLATMLFFAVTVPYALNAILWTRFYRLYPPDVAAMQLEMESRAARAAQASG